MKKRTTFILNYYPLSIPLFISELCYIENETNFRLNYAKLLDCQQPLTGEVRTKTENDPYKIENLCNFLPDSCISSVTIFCFKAWNVRSYLLLIVHYSFLNNCRSKTDLNVERVMFKYELST